MGGGAKNPKYDKFQGETPTGELGGQNTPMASGAPIAYTGAFGQPADQFADTTSSMMGGSAAYIPEGAPDSTFAKYMPQEQQQAPPSTWGGPQGGIDLGYEGFNPEQDYHRRQMMRGSEGGRMDSNMMQRYMQRSSRGW